MFTLSVEELKNQKVVESQPCQMWFNNRNWNLGPSFAKNKRDVAMEFCQDYFQNNHLCLLVEYDCFVTVWIEKSDF